MSVVKVIELITEGDSIENAVENGLKEAQETIQGIKSIYIKDVKAMVNENAITRYRLVVKVSFVINRE